MPMYHAVDTSLRKLGRLTDLFSSSQSILSLSFCGGREHTVLEKEEALAKEMKE